MGGQVGDTGLLTHGGESWTISDTRKAGDTWLHFISGPEIPEPGQDVSLVVDCERRSAIERHHTVTHLLHWALHEVVSREATQKGSYVGPRSSPLTSTAPRSRRRKSATSSASSMSASWENAVVSWSDVAYGDVKNRADVMQIFGDKYGDRVRVVQIGGGAQCLDGYSMELAAARTHGRPAKSDFSAFSARPPSQPACAVSRPSQAWKHLTTRSATPSVSWPWRRSSTLPSANSRKSSTPCWRTRRNSKKALKAASQREATARRRIFLPHLPSSAARPPSSPISGRSTTTRSRLRRMRSRASTAASWSFSAGSGNGAVSLVATVSPEFTAKFAAGKIIQAIAPIVGGKGGGRPDQARGGGKDAAKLADALAHVRSLLS